MNISLNSHLFQNIFHIIFDKDGTITDSHAYWGEIIKRRAISLQKLFPEYSLSCHEIELALGYDSKTCKLLPSGPIAIKNRDEVIDNLLKFFGDKDIEITRDHIEDVFSYVHSDFVKESCQFIIPINGVTDFIKILNENKIKISLITSDTIEGARSSLDKLEILNYFDFIAGKDSGFGHKVSGQPAVEACKTVDISPKNTIIIGDAPMDYLMGLNSGINSILVATGQINHGELLETTPFVCNNVTELRLKF